MTKVDGLRLELEDGTTIVPCGLRSMGLPDVDHQAAKLIETCVVNGVFVNECTDDRCVRIDCIVRVVDALTNVPSGHIRGCEYRQVDLAELLIASGAADVEPDATCAPDRLARLWELEANARYRMLGGWSSRLVAPGFVVAPIPGQGGSFEFWYRVGITRHRWWVLDHRPDEPNGDAGWQRSVELAARQRAVAK